MSGNTLKIGVYDLSAAMTITSYIADFKLIFFLDKFSYKNKAYFLVI